MTEEKIAKLKEIAEMIPEISKARTNAFTGYLNAESCLEIEKLNLNMIDDFSEFIYKNVSDLCRFVFLFDTLKE